MTPLSKMVIGATVFGLIFFSGNGIALSPTDLNSDLMIVQGNTLTANSMPYYSSKTMAVKGFTYDSDIYYLLSQYDWDSDLMMKIAFCESGFNAHAIGDRNTAYKSYGILQIRNLPSRNYPIETLFDPAENIRIGYDIFLKQGYGAWKNCYRKSI